EYLSTSVFILPSVPAQRVKTVTHVVELNFVQDRSRMRWCAAFFRSLRRENFRCANLVHGI
ncbi:MAG TPA: hypothetical protein VFV92_01300, partial [Candidatus Bathyarchaeia archaeon]|nr:hypothetical protein [Candidatus Bathyarchaeia archaeon]